MKLIRARVNISLDLTPSYSIVSDDTVIILGNSFRSQSSCRLALHRREGDMLSQRVRLISLVSLLALQYIITAMELARAIASLKAAELCLQEGLVNSAASRAYYAMFQAAQIALEAEGLVRSEWSHKGLHSSFNQELIHRRKLYPRVLRDHLTSALAVRQAADYGETGVSAKIAQRQARRAATFVQTVAEVISRGKPGQR